MSALSGGDLNTSEGPEGGLRRHWDADDQLPEWATENPSDYGGSFDASGPFHDSDNGIDGRLEDDGGMENHVDHRYHHQRKEGVFGGSSRRSAPSSKEGSAAKEDLPNHAALSAKASEEVDPGSRKKSEPVRNATADEKPPKSSESESRRPRWRSRRPATAATNPGRRQDPVVSSKTS
ncbi:GRB10-interacting GYF protein 2-like [Culex pipiens pallens]|uniref:GRB10-interacting GYF protein 2-like n=1 Tax=Culex pipiens pallens TaxID=42434 RepID=UPI0022AAAFEB|nr:GRB10-interacting GYF protein 2-like [Culex pipiens pallens]